MPLFANITVTAIRHRPVVQITCVERSVIIVHMIPSAVQENAAGTMVNARQDVRIASVNAPMVFHAEKCTRPLLAGLPMRNWRMLYLEW